MKKVPRLVWSLLACLVCIVVTAVACLTLSDKAADSDKYQEIIKIVESTFYEQRSTDAMTDASAKAMIASLEDPSSFYMTVEEYESYKLAMTNQYIGIGITTEQSEKYGFLTVQTVALGSPADLAHVKVGNMISAVNNIDVSAYTPEEFLALIQSFDLEEDEADRYFTIHLLNSQGGKAEVRLKCELIYAKPVNFYMLEDSRIGYIRIENFDDSAAVSLKSAVAELREMGATSLILDVRDNRNGKPAELAESLDYLLPKGDLFLLRDRSGRETTYSSGSSSVQNMRMAVLVNENSICAAEMFACVMQQAGVPVVGRRTPGAALSQVTVEMEDGSAVRISKFAYLTPDKKSLEELGGIMPDYPSYQIEDSSMDVQLEAAKDVVE